MQDYHATEIKLDDHQSVISFWGAGDLINDYVLFLYGYIQDN